MEATEKNKTDFGLKIEGARLTENGREVLFEEISVEELPRLVENAALSALNEPHDERGFFKVVVPRKKITLGGEKYDEAFLATLRDLLKKLDEFEKPRVLVSIEFSGGALSVDDALDIADTARHCARRIKDCACVAGFEIPAAFEMLAERCGEAARNFVNGILPKHDEYFFGAARAVHDALKGAENSERVFLLG